MNDLTSIKLATWESVVQRPQSKGEVWPPALESHTAVINTEKKAMILFGGQAGYKASADVYEYNFESTKWQRIPISNGPRARSNHSAAIHKDSMFVYGGRSNEGDILSDVWELNLTSYVWSQVDYKPGPDNEQPQVR